MLVLSSCATRITSITGAAVNENGELIITYNDGSEQNLGVVVGKDGADGKDGAPGKDGVDGKDGASATDTAATYTALKSVVSVWCPLVDPYLGESSMYSTGAGVIYKLDKQSGDAFIITNYHVIYNTDDMYNVGICDDISVYLYGDQSSDGAISATFVGGSINNDIAILKITDSDILKKSSALAVTVANSDEICVGERAIAIGNPEGDGFSVPSGIVSVDSEYIDLPRADEMGEISLRVMRIDTPVNHGNSGGGLFDSHGSLIGIVTAKHVEDGVDDFGYAIPSSTVVALAENIIDNCYGTNCTTLMKALMGVTVSSTGFRAVYDDETNRVRLMEDIIVLEVSPGSLADGSLMADDIIKEIKVGSNEKVTLDRQYKLLNALLYARLYDDVTLTVERDGETLTFNLIIGDENIVEY